MQYEDAAYTEYLCTIRVHCNVQYIRTYTMGKVKETTHFFAFVVGAPPSYLYILTLTYTTKLFVSNLRITESLDIIKRIKKN